MSRQVVEHGNDRFPCGSPKYPADDVHVVKPMKEPCGPFYALCQVEGIDPKSPDAQDALMSALWASASQFRKGIK